MRLIIEEVKGKIASLETQVNQVERVRDIRGLVEQIAILASRIDNAVAENEQRTNIVKAQASCIELRVQQQDHKFAEMEAQLEQMKFLLTGPSTQSMTTLGNGPQPLPSHSTQLAGVIKPILPLVMPLPHSQVRSIRWTKALTKLAYQPVRSFVTLFKSYLNVSNPSEDEAKIILLQSLEGEAMGFVTPIAERFKVREILEKPMTRVRPSENVIMKKLLDMRMKPSESVMDYTGRFTLLSNGLPMYSDSRERDIFVESVTPQWKLTARSLIMNDSHIRLQDLAQKLMTLEGSDHADRMEIDALSVDVMRLSLAQEDEDQCPDLFDEGKAMVNAVQRRCMIYFAAIKSVGDFIDALRNIANGSNSRLKQECMDILRGHIMNGPLQRNPNWRRQGDAFAGPSRGQPAREFAIEKTTETVPLPIKEDKEDPMEELPTIYTLGQARQKRSSMACQIKINGTPASALVDIGANVSTIKITVCKRLGVAVDESRLISVKAFNETLSKTLGAVDVNVTVGDISFMHEFQVVGFNLNKVIMGFDIMRDMEFVPDPKNGQLMLSNRSTVKCHLLKKPIEDREVLRVMKTMSEAFIPQPSSLKVRLSI